MFPRIAWPAVLQEPGRCEQLLPPPPRTHAELAATLGELEHALSRREPVEAWFEALEDRPLGLEPWPGVANRPGLRRTLELVFAEEQAS